jgi:hypothetical protein
MLKNFKKVEDSFTVNRYENGWMVHIVGNSETDQYIQTKIMCGDVHDVYALIQEYSTKELSY